MASCSKCKREIPSGNTKCASCTREEKEFFENILKIGGKVVTIAVALVGIIGKIIGNNNSSSGGSSSST